MTHATQMRLGGQSPALILQLAFPSIAAGILDLSDRQAGFMSTFWLSVRWHVMK